MDRNDDLVSARRRVFIVDDGPGEHSRCRRPFEVGVRYWRRMARGDRAVYCFAARRYRYLKSSLLVAVTYADHLLLASPYLFATLRLKSRIVMKLGLLTGPAVPNDLLSQCLVCLHHLEKDLTLPAIPITPGTSSQPRHTSYSHRDVHTSDSHIVWGEVVVSLWRASMTLGSSGRAWDELTPRILIWNLLVDGEDQVAEWARREVVRNTTRTT